MLGAITGRMRELLRPLVSAFGFASILMGLYAIWRGIGGPNDIAFDKLSHSSCQPPNKQLHRSVIPSRVRGARAPFQYARAPRFIRQRAAAELLR
jgi:hypothetical protein